MNLSTRLVKPPSEDYDEDVLYGPRREATRRVELIKLDSNSECVTYTIGTFVDRQQWNLKNLIGLDKRIKSMLDGTETTHALPIQRFCWPQMNRATFPFVCVSPESTGKTYCHLLFIVSKSISAISLAKTDEMISETDYLGSFRTDTKLETKVIDPCDNQDIDLEKFDYDSLGKEPINCEKRESAEPCKINPEDFITHPNYIIICSSHLQVEKIEQDIDRMKSAAYGNQVTDTQRRKLPPVVRTINSHQDEDKLALRCIEGEILVTTPAALVRCFEPGFIDFSKSKMIIFDEIDLTLQLHNFKVREIIKRYLIQVQYEDLDSDESSSPCQMYLFSRKWTDLVKKFVASVFVQRTLIFGSMVEASLLANLRYELEIFTDDSMKLTKLYKLARFYAETQSDQDITAIVCNNKEEARLINSQLSEINTLVLDEDEDSSINKVKRSVGTISKPVYIISDSTLEFMVEFLNNTTHLIHYSLPENMLIFDRRFKLMYSHIKNAKRNLVATIFLSIKNKVKHLKEIHDLLSRSSSTLNSTKLELRDLISDTSSTICWRWASTGLCRLEKLSREDRLGSYCLDRHSMPIDSWKELNEAGRQSRWPIRGQVKITITHLVCPNEFYFWFEAHRNIDTPNRKWIKFESSGSGFMADFQQKLDKIRDQPSCSVSLAKFKKGKIFGVYQQQEARVDRVMLLDDPFAEDADETKQRKHLVRSKLKLLRLDYSKQCEVYKVDYGTRIHVYLRNLFEIPASLVSVEPQCHRGFHIGVKPTDDEPNWLYKAKKHFYDNVCVNDLHEITVWIRLASNSCFWFENMFVSRKLSNINGGSYLKNEPHRTLIQAGLAVKCSSEPSCLLPSDRLETLSKWHVDESVDNISHAFLRKDKSPLDIFVLHIKNDLSLIVRQIEFNKQLIRLETSMLEEYKQNKLVALSYLATGTYCLARICEQLHPISKVPLFSINRCKIVDIKDSPANQGLDDVVSSRYVVYCLDHGDVSEVDGVDLYQASPGHLSQLPFQAINVKLADLNPELFKDPKLTMKVQDLLYDYTRDERDQLRSLKCRFNTDGDLYLYLSQDGELYESFIARFERDNAIDICLNSDPILRNSLRTPKEDKSNSEENTRRGFLRKAVFESLVNEMLRSLAKQELSAVGVEVNGVPDLP